MLGHGKILSSGNSSPTGVQPPQNTVPFSSMKLPPQGNLYHQIPLHASFIRKTALTHQIQFPTRMTWNTAPHPSQGKLSHSWNTCPARFLTEDSAHFPEKRSRPEYTAPSPMTKYPHPNRKKNCFLPSNFNRDPLPQRKLPHLSTNERDTAPPHRINSSESHTYVH